MSTNLEKALAELVAQRVEHEDELNKIEHAIDNVKLALTALSRSSSDSRPVTMMGVIRQLAADNGKVTAMDVRNFILANELPLKIKSIYPCLASKSLKKVAPGTYKLR